MLATPILTLLFGAKDHLQLSALLLQTGSLSVVLYGMSTLTNGILQGMDKDASAGHPCGNLTGTARSSVGSASDGNESEHPYCGMGKYFLCIPDVYSEFQVNCKIYAIPSGI